MSQIPPHQDEREQALLDAAAELFLRHGYNKTTMSDVADTVGLHRGLLYLRFKSKDELVEALIIREIGAYMEAWSNQLNADPLGGSVASVYRGMLRALKPLPLMIAILTRDDQTFGKYLNRPGNIFTRLSTTSITRDFLQAMQEAGAVRQDANIPAMAYIMDALTPSILETLAFQIEERRSNTKRPDIPSYDELLQTISEMLERMLTPAEGADLEAGKAIMRRRLENARVRFTEALAQQKKEKK